MSKFYSGLQLRAATATINTHALRDNLAQVRRFAPRSKVLAVVKANAYGHGLLPVAQHLDEVDAFGVARIEEALTLRAGGVVRPILLLEGFYSLADLSIAVTNNIHTVVHTIEQLQALEQASLDQAAQVWLKIDTGMNRLGVRPEQVDEFVRRLEACPNVVKPLRYISHFCCADELDNPFSVKQMQRFNAITQHIDGERSLAASAGICCWPDSHYQWVRPGIMLYGVSPLETQSAASLGLSPVMTLSASLIAINDVKQGETVGYGGAWRAERDTRVGVVAIGYGDGYPRMAPNGTPVLVNGRRVNIVGRVSMDMLTVDLGPDATDAVGDTAVLWGDGLPAEEVAAHIGTIAYELVTKLTARVITQYV
ncbi:alanine racemase [Thaumasiovibrio sp. DFM-14]|uniref:alanine racemase n=1 Tax=Thaumasiovibrio sp. DFM-14 TaxID=3384792 RepID=UPI00399FF87B